MTVKSSFFEGINGFGAHLLDQAEVRARVADFYRSHEGLRSSGKTSAEYEQLMFPNDRPEWRRRAADEMFSCALRFLAGCRLMGVPHPVLAEPYEQRLGMAVADSENVARAYGALVQGAALATYEPSPGDALLSGPGDSVHVSCVVGEGPDPSDEGATYRRLVCVDGGQGAKGDMAVERNVYLLERGPDGQASLRSIEAPRYSYARPGPAKPLRWCVDIWTLVLNAGLLK
ncbi:MAG TPA: hypothetical protein VFS00_00745 [Polyangiaceae bacterium]|nr:hypothetical protein [Polyangiaceae bacterium]